MAEEFKIEVGGYYLKGTHGSVVRIEEEVSPDRYRIGYVQVVDYAPEGKIGNQVMSGGGSFAWGPEVFSQITDAADMAAAQCFESQRKAAEYKKMAATAEYEAEMWRRTLSLLRNEKLVAMRKEKANG